MKVAVTYDRGMILQHFGKSERFKVYNVSDGRVVSTDSILAYDRRNGATVDLLRVHGVDALICGEIESGTKLVLDEAGITLYAGVRGDADRAVRAMLDGYLQPARRCASSAAS